jgi:pimeloyl-ACP methyl ester carboxylesterase
MSGGVDEITQALDGMRAKGAHSVFLAGHSQGGLFAPHYAGLHRVEGVLAIAPGGQVDASVFVTNLSSHVARAKQMVDEGRGNDKASFSAMRAAEQCAPELARQS